MTAQGCCIGDILYSHLLSGHFNVILVFIITTFSTCRGACVCTLTSINETKLTVIGLWKSVTMQKLKMTMVMT